MKKMLMKSARLKLDRKTYAALHRQILKRDNWRCQSCGSMKHLEIHHQEFRSHSGGDIEENLVTLCHSCHSAAHAT